MYGEDDPQLKDRVRRLLTFLAELVKSRGVPVRHVDGHQRVIWLDTATQSTQFAEDAVAGDIALRASRVFADPAPELPRALGQFVVGAIDDSSVPPSLTIQGQRLGAEFEIWFAKWRRWAQSDQERRPAIELYDQLQLVMRDLDAKPESLELVVASGLLDLTDSHTGAAAKTHVITQHAVVERDVSSGDLLVRLMVDSSPRLEDTQLLTGLAFFDASGAIGQQASLASRVHSPLASSVSVFLKEWAERAITTRLEVVEAAGGDRTISVSPALVLRKRSAAMLIDYYERMIESVESESTSVPLGLAQLVAAFEPEERIAWLDRTGSTSSGSLAQDPLFPLPANQEQSEIIERLAHDSGVVVEGPPGTGKTHTIANLISALLARGQRVLVTSEKAQALRVLRDKLPQEMQDLCVSVTDAGRGGSAELNRSVAEIASRKASFSVRQSELTIDDLLSRRKQALVDRAKLVREIRSVRAWESVSHREIAPGYSGTAAQIVQRVNELGGQFDWLPGPVVGSAPPLSADQMARLVELSTGSNSARVALLQQDYPVLSDVLPPLSEVRSRCSAALAGRDVARGDVPELRRLLSGANSDTLRGVCELCDQLQAAVGNVCDQDPAYRSVADRVLSGRASHLWHKTEVIGGLVDVASAADREVGSRTVETATTTRAALEAWEALAAALEGGQPWRAGVQRFFKSSEQRNVEALGEHATVDGVKATTARDAYLVAAHLRAIDAANVSSAIMADLGVETAAAGSRSRRVNELHELRSAIRSVDQLVSRAAAVVGLLQSLNRSAPRIHSVAQADSLAAAAGTVAVAADAQQSIEWLNSVAVQVSKVCGPNAPQECADLELALQSANWDSIVSAFRAIEVAREQQKQEREFNALIGRLEQAAPELGSLIRQTPNDIRWPQWLRSFEDAWAWRCAHTWSQNQHDRGRDAKLERKLDDLDRDVAVLTSRVAAEMSWQACLSRVTATQVQALQSYRDHIASVGKGTGRHAERFRASAREAMLAAQGAVPAWVLPLQQVLASIPPEQNSFDVVIVDEASQADITSLFLLWLAPRVIVVGDDKQCAPSEVASGSFDGIFDKLDAYLPDMPGYLRNGFTPRSSMFSLLRSRFGNLVRLREHFRSMPEIIEWSSSQFYRDAPLVPLRQFGADRLPPLRTTFVEDGVESGKYASLSNRPEAMAIANEVERCLQNPAYDRMSFGVVVLQGQAQVELIQSELLSRISADDWDDRRLRVGTPPDFQGDERNVVFLSLVVGPDQQIRALTSNADQRRFNVGASRAQDQLWLFHSRPAESLRPSDLRHSLLTYMQITSPKSATAMPSDVSDIDRHPAFESIFEQRLYLEIAARGYQVNPQVEINRHRIDLVVTGAATRIAIECDGDTWQSGEERSDFEFDRELELKRCGWVFLRVRESQYYLDPFAVLRELWAQFDERGIQPIAVPVHHQRADRVDWQPARLPIDDQPASGLDDSLKTSTVEQPSADERYEEPAAQASTEPLLAAQQRDSTGAIDRVLGKAHHTPDDLRAAVLEEAKVGPVTTAGLAVAMGEDRGVLRKALRELVRTGELERQPGPKRGAQYVLSQVAVDEHSYGADEPDQAVESTTIPAWEVMASAAVLELPTRTGSRIYEIVRTSPSTELNLAVALGISRAHVVAAAGELVAQGRLVATDVDGGRGYSIPQARREPSASAPQQLHERTIVVQQLSDAAVEASAALLMSASEIAPLTLTRAARLTRANKSEVQRILSMLETAGRLEAIRVDSEVAWVRAEA